jgi:hypothetical protein
MIRNYAWDSDHGKILWNDVGNGKWMTGLELQTSGD